MKNGLKIAVNGYNFKIKFVDKDHKKFRVNESELDILGCADIITGCVYIRNDLNDRTMRSTINHELTHVYAFCYGANLVDEESVCDFIGSYLEVMYETTDLIFNEWKKHKTL